LKDRTFTYSEQSDFFNKVDELIQNFDKKACFSSETKRSCLALACIVGIGISFLFFQNCASLGLIYDKQPGVKVEFLKELATLSSEEKKYYCSNFLGGLASIAAAIWCGYESETGYYTDQSRYIHNLLMKHFGQRLIRKKNHIKDL
jgi:hypothetical protein